jgi:hypothetical protein
LAANTNPKVDQKIIDTAIGTYCAEGGRDKEKISALMFVNEASSELGSFLESDCAYRVKGGTEELIKALRVYLQAKGVNFETNAKLQKVSKAGEKFHLDFEVKPESGDKKI